jgi:hypothetical protein
MKGTESLHLMPYFISFIPFPLPTDAQWVASPSKSPKLERPLDYEICTPPADHESRVYMYVDYFGLFGLDATYCVTATTQLPSVPIGLFAPHLFRQQRRNQEGAFHTPTRS